MTDSMSIDFIKAWQAFKITACGLRTFVVGIMDDFLDLAFPADKCNKCLIENVIKCPTRRICNLQKYSQVCTFHDKFKPRACPNNICEGVKDFITSAHRYGSPCFTKSTKTELWSSCSWELAKCYMPISYQMTANAADADLPGILSIILNNLEFKRYIDADLGDPNCIFSKVRDIRNIVAHSPNMVVTEKDVRAYIDMCIDLLSDPKALSSDHHAREARNKLQQLKHEEIHITKREKEEANREYQMLLKRELKENLIGRYMEMYCVLPHLPFLPNGQLELDETFVFPAIVEDPVTKGKTIPLPERVRLQSISELFEQKSTRRVRKYFLTADAGMGKTVLCHKIISAWCRVHRAQENTLDLTDADKEFLKSFDFLFYIPLRLFRAVSVNEWINENLVPKTLSNAFKILNNEDNENCLIILDALDEWRFNAKNDTEQEDVYNGLPEIRPTSLATVLITTRPWRFEILRDELTLQHLSRKLSIIELTNDSVRKIVENVLDHLNKSFMKCKLPSDFFRQFNEATLELKEQFRIPSFLFLIICLWFEEKILGNSNTDVFSKVTEMLLEKYHKSHSATDRAIDLPKNFRSLKHCRKSSNLIKQLATLAFHTLLGKDKTKSLVFTKEDVEDFLDNETVADKFLESGLLQIYKPETNFMFSDTNLSFCHKAYQEFFCALHFCLDNSAIEWENMNSFCNKIENSFELENVFALTCELQPCLAEAISNVLSQSVKIDNRFAVHQSLSNESTIVYDRIQKLVFKLAEIAIKRLPSLTLKLELRDLLLDIFNEHDDILTKLPIVNKDSIKSLSVSTMSPIRILQEQLSGLKDLYRFSFCSSTQPDSLVFSILSASIQTLTTFIVSGTPGSHRRSQSDGLHECLDIPSMIKLLDKIPTLSCIAFKWLKMSHEEMQNVLSFIARKTLLVEIELCKIACIEHGSNDCNQKLHLGLEKHCYLKVLLLRSVLLSKISLSDGGLAYLEQCLLVSLHEEANQVIKFLRNSTNLIELTVDLKDQRTRKAGLSSNFLCLRQAIPNFSQLQMLELQNVNFCEEESAFEVSFQSLRSVIIRSTQMTASCLISLTKLVQNTNCDSSIQIHDLTLYSDPLSSDDLTDIILAIEHRERIRGAELESRIQKCIDEMKEQLKCSYFESLEIGYNKVVSLRLEIFLVK